VMFLILIVIFVVSIVVWYQIAYRRQNELVAKIPSPRSYPLIRNSLEFRGKSPKELFKMMGDLSVSLGPVYQLTLHSFDNPLVFLTDPKAAEQVLSSQSILDKSEDYDLMRNWLGTGLLLSTGKKWFQRRKILTPSFHFQILEKFVEIMDEQGKILMEKLEKLTGQEVDVVPLVNLYALDVICGE
jgi:cytochrome P450 family 4